MIHILILMFTLCKIREKRENWKTVFKLKHKIVSSRKSQNEAHSFGWFSLFPNSCNFSKISVFWIGLSSSVRFVTWQCTYRLCQGWKGKVGLFLLDTVVAYWRWKYGLESKNLILMESIALTGFSLDVMSFMQGLGRAGASTVHLLVLIAVCDFCVQVIK